MNFIHLLNKRAITYQIILAMILISSCSKDAISDIKTVSDNKLFSSLDPDSTGLHFTNQLVNTESFNIFNYRNFYNGGGVAIGDINNDGLPDVYLTSNQGANKLFLNNGDFKFQDLSKAAQIQSEDKWSTGVTLVDINTDGFLDIYVCNAGHQNGIDQKNNLYINQGDLTFVDEAEKYGLADNGYTTHAAFFDYDRDGDLDVYLLNNSFIPVNTLNYSNKRELNATDWPVKDFLKGGGDKLMRNDGGSFINVSEEAGIYSSLIGFGLGVTVGDVNDDNFPDIYVSNDFFERDYLYINNGKGGFSEELEQRIGHLSHSSMGADLADINNDGYPEIFVTDMLPDDDYRLKTTSTFDNINLRNLKLDKGFYNQYMHNTLQLNDGTGVFKEISFFSGVAASDWSWGALMLDADNDMNTDLFVCNGILNDVIDQDFIDFFADEVIQKMVLDGNKQEVDSIISKMPSVPIVNKLFKGDGQLRFTEHSKEWGLDEETFSNGAAYGDLDNDGDLDLIVNNINQPAQLFENRSTNNYLSISLKYKDPNALAIGSKVKVFCKDKTLFRELMPSRGFQSSVDYKLVFGLGEITDIDSVLITWPDGKKQVEYISDLNKEVAIKYLSNNKSVASNVVQLYDPYFASVPNGFDTYKEDDYEDFHYERNIPMQLSKEGPCSAIGDYNGDGYMDVFIGAAAGTSPCLYEGSKDGYRKTQEVYFNKFKAFEDVCAEFIDVDGDNDLDLLVGSGGNNVTYAKRAFRDRLYLNRNGKFEINLNAIPPNHLNTACMKPFDYDGDGDQDLFVGSRSVPGEYGLSPGSYIYNNNGKGQFLDVTQKVIPDLALAGMITDAQWADILPQKGVELILVGEWMAPKVLSYDGVKFNIIESTLSEYAGWWQAIETSDLDQDGDLDILLGNIGDNFYLKADTLNPLFLWLNDFDDNGSLEKLITKRVEGEDRPVVVKRDLVDQLPSLKKENLMHSEYANKSLQQLFSKDKIRKAIIKQINITSSLVAYNNGDGSFEIEKLDNLVQLSSANAFCKIDVDADGDDDIMLGGNNHFLLPQFSRLDACSGKLLINDSGELNLVSRQESGINLKGVVREIKKIPSAEGVTVLALINDDKPVLYKLKK